MEISKIETIKKATKLKNLADQGYGGEQANATRELFRFMKENNIQFSEIEQYEKSFKTDFKISVNGQVFYDWDDFDSYYKKLNFWDKMKTAWQLIKNRKNNQNK